MAVRPIDCGRSDGGDSRSAASSSLSGGASGDRMQARRRPVEHQQPQRNPVPLTCANCGRLSDREAAGWRGFIANADIEDMPELLFFCPECAERELGG